jgi:glycosyltransferase involved in cell wall biosynthesis
MKKINKIKKENVFIVIPGLNEEKHIGLVISKIKKLGYENIVFVDDGSCDKSSQIATKEGAKALKHIVNLGKGSAAKTGCEYAITQGADVLVLMDADGQHNPDDLKKMLIALKGNDIVFGFRHLNKNMPFMMRLGNWGINKSSQIINGITLNDTQSGFRCMTSDAYKKIKWYSNDYSMESEMIANVAKHKLKYIQVPIETIYHDDYKGTTIVDGIKIFINMLKFKIRRY